MLLTPYSPETCGLIGAALDMRALPTVEHNLRCFLAGDVARMINRVR